MSPPIILREPRHVEYAINAIRALRLDPAEPFEVEIRRHKSKRSLAQNDLLWAWCQIIGEDTGNTKDDIYEYLAEQFLPPREVMGVLVRARPSKLNTAEFTAYLEKVAGWAASEGFNLPPPVEKGYD